MTIEKAEIGKKAPLFSVSDWVQGDPINLDQLAGRVVLLEVFQVNCPGCFLYALPHVIDLFERYYSHGLTVFGIATAFEDFDKNSLPNLRRLVEKQEVIGETYKALSQRDLLDNGHLPYNIPFPIAMDCLVKNEAVASEEEIVKYVKQQIPDFDEHPKSYKDKIIQQVRNHFEKLEYRAQTFEKFNLKGTPSYILVDKLGMLRACEFGDHSDLENRIRQLLRE